MPEDPVRSVHGAVDLGRLVALLPTWQMPLADDRLLTAVIRVLGRRGYGGLTTKEVIGTARVGRNELYRRFSGKHDCFLAAYETLLGELERKAARREEDSAASRTVEAWLEAVARVLARDRRMARILVLEAGHADIRSFSDFLADGIAERLSGEVPDASLVMATGSIAETVRSHLLRHGASKQAWERLPAEVATTVASTFPRALLGRPRAFAEPRGQLLDFNAAYAARRRR